MGASLDHLVQSPAQSKISSSRLPGTTCSCILNICQRRPLEPAAFNHSNSEKVFFFVFKWNLLYFNFPHMLLVLSLNITEKSLAQSSLLPIPSGIFNIDRIPTELSLFQAKQCQLFQPLLAYQVVQFPKQLHGSSLGSFHYVHVLHWGAQNSAQ